MKKNRPLISVVTVCRNAADSLEKTMISVLEQDYPYMNYVIIDGASTDHTKDIVNKYFDTLEKKGIIVKYISEPDQGIYDAMNKALHFVSGDWIIFLNAGDTFAEKHTLLLMSTYLEDTVGVLYGDIIIQEAGKYKRVECGSIHDMRWKNPIHHQGALTRTDLVREYAFNLQYRIVADYDLYLRLCIDHVRFVRLRCPIAVFEMGGMSDVHFLQCQYEMENVRRKNHVKTSKSMPILITKTLIYRTLRKTAKIVLGSRFYSEWRGWFSKEECILQNYKM